MMRKYFFILSLLITVAQEVLSQSWVAREAAFVGDVATYMFSDGAPSPDPAKVNRWSVTPQGKIELMYISGMYVCQIRWMTAGFATVKFDGAEYNVRVYDGVSPPNTTFSSQVTCGQTTISRLQSPPEFVTWYWQTVPNGTDKSNSSSTFVKMQSGPVYLRAEMYSKWSTSQYIGDVAVYTAPTVPAVANDVRGFKGGAVTVSVSAVADVEGYRWYFQSAGGSIVTGSGTTNLHTILNLSAETSYYVSAYNRACESVSRRKVTASVEPIPTISASASSIYLGKPVLLSTTSVYDSYKWINAVGATVSQSAVLETAVPGVYTVTVTKNGVVGEGVSLPVVLNRGFGDQVMNYIERNSIQDGNVYDPAAVEGLNVDANTQTVDYFDGLGTPLQKVVTQGAPSKRDVVLPIAYDRVGRPYRTYLPFVPATSSGTYKSHAEILGSDGSYIGIAEDFYGEGSTNKIADDSKPYAQTVFEPGSGQRVMKYGAPGVAWQPDGTAPMLSSDHTTKYSYEVNDVVDVLLLKYVYPGDASPFGSVRFPNPSLYPIFGLFRRVTRDEHGSRIEEFTDKNGRVVLKRVQVGDREYAQTYYVYDDFGQLTHVLQPEATAAIFRELSPRWKTTSMVGVTYGNGAWTDAVVKDAASGYGNAGVFSERALAAGTSGWVEMAATETNTSRMIGLSASNTDNGVNMKYALEFRSDALIYAWEGGVSKRLLGKYRKGTIVRIAREGTAMRYYVDGQLQYTSPTASTEALFVDGALKETGATLTHVTCSFTIDANLPSILDNYAFRYTYDSHGRMVQKEVPGAAPVYMVYDLRDRLILTQDGNLRAKNSWHFTKYDKQNRPILTGVMDTAAAVTRDSMQSVVTRHFKRNAAGERFVGNVADNVFGYTNNTYPVYTTGSVVNPHKCLTVNYYDSYDYRTLWIGDYDYYDDGLKETVNGVEYKQPDNEGRLSISMGRVTGTMVRVLDEDRVWPLQSFTWLKTATYYDSRQRVVQTVSDNYRGGVERQSTLYDFVGKVLYSRLTHTTANPTWKDVVGVRAAGNRLFRNITNNTWGQAGVASQQMLAAGQDGWVEFTASEIGTGRMLGLSEQNLNANYPSIGHAFYLRADGALVIRRGDSELKVITSGFKPGDVLRIARVNGGIRYYQNGVEVYPAGGATPASSSAALLVDIAFGTRYGTLVNIRTSFSTATHEVNRRYVYDHAGRPTALYHSLGHGEGTTEVLLAKNTYNELGQLVDKGLHSVAGSAVQQSVDYRYNIRGWLTSINNAALTTDESNDEDSDYFGMNLAYNVPDAGLDNVPTFNGNISGISWSNDLGLSPVQQKGYTYSYDVMNRLTGSVYHDKTAAIPDAAAWHPYVDGQFAERDIQYDLNGNILQLKRNDGRTGSAMDLLSYDYGSGLARGNQLLKVTDAGDKGMGFAEDSNTGNDYAYDDNGNLTRDLNKRIGTGTAAGISYNLLNLPDMVTRGDNTVRYVYDAGGRKLMNQVDFISATKQTDYMGEFVYENDVLQFINHEEGRMVMANNKVMYANFGETLDALVAVNATLSTVTVGQEKYIRAVAAASGSLSGILPIGNAISVQAGEQYKIRVKGYRTSGGSGSSSDAAIRININGVAQAVPLAVLPNGPTTGNIVESWVEQVVTISTSGMMEAGVAWTSARPGEHFFVNEFEIVKLDRQDPEYQYFMKDHLGNVRLTFTSKPAAPETFSTDFEGEDNGAFENYSNSTYDLVDHTDVGTAKQNVQKLNGGVNGRVGVAKTFAVMPGDVISIKAFGKYMNLSNTANTNTLIASLAAVFGISATPTVDQLEVYEGLNSFAGLVEGGDHLDDDDSAPKAFATILLFDKDHNLVNAGWDQMSTDGAQTSATVKSTQYAELNTTLTASEPGYAYVFLSNEHPTFVDVYYDDVTVTYTPSPIVAMDDYYPFGLRKSNGYVRENSIPNRFTYNGKEEQNELGLVWLDYGARMYMSDIGRWPKIDPKAELYFHISPYAYAANTPTNAIDPDGRLVIFINGQHGGSGGKVDYWQKKEMVTRYNSVSFFGQTFWSGNETTEEVTANFASSVQDHFNDYSPARFYDGAIGGWENTFESTFVPVADNLSSGDRYVMGKKQGEKDAADIINSLARTGGAITESLKVVSHSMGGAYAKGFVQAIVDYAVAHPEECRGLKISQYDFDPLQGAHLRAIPGVHTEQYSHVKKDGRKGGLGWLANGKQAGLDDEQGKKDGNLYDEHPTDADHGIMSFFDNIQNLAEGVYIFQNGQWVKR